MSDSGNGSIRLWARVFRPLAWWFLLVLVLYGIRLHQRLMLDTRLNFSATVDGQRSYQEPTVTFDGHSVFSGQMISLGSHRITVTHPKGVTFTTNLFTWYGGHNLGQIVLPRAFGKLDVSAVPAAAQLTIRGPEFQVTLYNSSGTNLTVPTDNYSITAKYAYSEEERTTTVYAESSANVTIAPRFGSATVESEPTGATVFDENGRKLGNTPLTLQQLNAGLWKFSLERDNFEGIATSLVIAANQTNRFQANLVNRYYAAAMREARSYFKAGRYEEAAMSADEALKHKAADTAATDLRREALGFSHLALAKRNAERENYSEAITELNKAVKFIPDYAEAKQLLADYTQREANRAAAEQKRAAELAEQARRQQEADLAERRAQEKIRELHNSFNVLVSGFEGANQFQEHELVVNGEVNAIGAAIKQALTEGDPKFRIVRGEQPRSDLYALQARQLLVLSYRDCFVVCSQVRDGEVRILFKVLEYDHLPVLNLLGGLLTAALTQPQKTADMQEQFQKQIREGAPMVEARIRQAIGK